MKPNKLTPGKNIMWESMRMMLPEHKESIVSRSWAIRKKKRPELLDDEREIIFQAINESYMRSVPVTLVLFDPMEDIQRTGIITRIDERLQQVKLETEEDYDLIHFENIVKAYT